MTKLILIIDDESAFCDILYDTLAEDGYVIEAPRYLASAVGAALQGIYDLIILDLRMPGMNGLEIARLFKRQGLMTPILIMSGYIKDDVPQQLRDIGIRHMLSKPLGIGQIRTAVAAAMA